MNRYQSAMYDNCLHTIILQILCIKRKILIYCKMIVFLIFFISILFVNKYQKDHIVLCHIMFNIKKTNTYIHSYTILQKSDRRFFRGETRIQGYIYDVDLVWGCSNSHAKLGKAKIILASKSSKSHSSFSYIKIPKSPFSALKITKAISEYMAEMLIIVLAIRGIVQIYTINNFIKHSLPSPVHTISGVKGQHLNREHLVIVKYCFTTIHLLKNK